MASRRKKRQAREIYDLDRSPLAQRLTQKKFANLIGIPLHELKGLIKYKRSFLKSRDETSGGKSRPLCYPVGRLRVVNEKIKYQLGKIRLPDYVVSPRKGFGQWANAEAHIDAAQVLKLDICRFYPSVSRQYIARFFRDEFKMPADVAGLITELLTHDGKILYGAPATPVTAMLAHRRMFDEIDALCTEFETTMTLWVDNLTISGAQVPGVLLTKIRSVVASHSYKSHDVEFLHTNRFVDITGLNVFKGQIRPPNSSDLAIRDLERKILSIDDANEYEQTANTLLSRLGSQLYVLGTECKRGQRIAKRMNTIRQKRDKLIAQSVQHHC